MTMQVQTGVCRLGATFASCRENGSVLSRDIPKHSLMVAAMIDRQQTKMAAETTNRESVASPEETFAWMICAGARPRPPFAAVALCWVPGIATSGPTRSTPPIMNAPLVEDGSA